MYKMTRTEQETIICWDATEGTAHISTANPATLRKLEKLAAEFPEVYCITQTDDENRLKWFVMDARYIRFGKPASEARKEASRKNGLNSGFKPANLPHRETSTP